MKLQSIFDLQFKKFPQKFQIRNKIREVKSKIQNSQVICIFLQIFQATYWDNVVHGGESQNFANETQPCPVLFVSWATQYMILNQVNC